MPKIHLRLSPGRGLESAFEFGRGGGLMSRKKSLKTL
jgi:hypothetical protein